MGILVSFDLSSDFGFFKKPDINSFGLTYNIPPKPVILGIIGSILGMGGLSKQYEETSPLEKLFDMLSDKDKNNKIKHLNKKINFHEIKAVLVNSKFKKLDRLIELLKMPDDKNYDFGELKEILKELKIELQYPEFYRKLKHLRVGIKPPEKNFPFNKIMNKYNSRNSYYYTIKDDKEADTANISEQLLIKPTYRIYVYDENNEILDELAKRIQDNNPIFMPYLGKNEFIITMKNLDILHDVIPIKDRPTQIDSIFLRNENGEDKSNAKTSKRKLGDATGTMVSGLPQGYRFVEQYPTSYSNEMYYILHMAEYTSRSDEISMVDLTKGILVKVHDQTIYLL